MARTRLMQSSFNGGVISPQMFGQFEDSRYRNGLAECRNALPQPEGPLSIRPGTRYVNSTKNNGKARLVEFGYSSDQTMVLEIGEGYIRFHTSGATLRFTAPASSRTYAAPNNLLENASSHIITDYGLGYSAIDFAAAHNDVSPHNLEEGDFIEFQLSSATESVYPELEDGGRYYVRTVPLRASFNTNYLSDIYTVNSIAHNLTVGDEIQLSKDATATYPTVDPSLGFVLEDATTYYVVEVPDANNFYISRTQNGEAMYFTANKGGTGDVYIHKMGQPDPDKIAVSSRLTDTPLTLTAPAGTSTIRVYRGYQPGDVVQFGNYYAQAMSPDPLEMTPASAPQFWQLFYDGDIYEITSPFREEDLFDISFSQSNDVLSLLHPEHGIHELQRLSATLWVLRLVTTAAPIGFPDPISVAATVGEEYDIRLDAQGVGPSGDLRVLLPGVTGGFSAQALGFTNGAFIEIDAPGYTLTSPARALSGTWVVTDDNPGNTNEFEIGPLGGGSTAQWGFSAGSPTAAVTVVGQVRLSSEYEVTTENSYVMTSVDANGVESDPTAPTTIDNNLFVRGAYNTITFIGVSGASRYYIYKKLNGIYGYIGQVNVGEPGLFVDDNIDPDLSRTPPTRDSSLSVTHAEVRVDSANNQLVLRRHGLANRTQITYRARGTAADGLVDGQTYYVIPNGLNTIQLAETEDGAAITINDNGDGRQEIITTGGPRAVGHYEQRRIFAGTTARPQTVWMTRTGTEADLSYHIPILDDDRINFTLATRRYSEIRHIVPADHLMLLTSESEIRVTPINNDQLTPESVSVRPQSHIGASTVQPVIVNNIVLFCAARGGHVREMGFDAAQQGFVTGDLSLRAAHLFDTHAIVDSAFSKSPKPFVLYTSSTGRMLALTYVPEERVVGWSWHDSPGNSGTDVIESVAAASEGDEDRVYVVVKRTINGNTVRFIERMAAQARPAALEDAYHVDAGLTYSGAAATTLRNLTHLVGETVSILSNSTPSTAVVTQPAALACTFSGDTVTAAGHDYAGGEEVTFSGSVLPNELVSTDRYLVRDVSGDDFKVERVSGLGAITFTGSPVSVTVRGSGRVAVASTTKAQIGLPFTMEMQTLPAVLQLDGLGRGRKKNVERVWLDTYRSASFEVGPSLTSMRSTNPRSEAETLQTGEVSVAISGSWQEWGQIFVRQTQPLPVTVTTSTLMVSLGG